MTLEDRPLTTNPIEQLLLERTVGLLDGGLATALETRGHRLDSGLWSGQVLIDDPDEIRAVHCSYLQSGADCITTSSYQLSFDGLAAADVDSGAATEALRRSSELALEARAEMGRPDVLVAASIGPYGAHLADGSEYHGRYGVATHTLDQFHRRRFEVLSATEVDLMACETIPSLIEADVLLDILDDHPAVWAWMSFSCRNGTQLADGSSFAEAVQRCAKHERVAAIGFNCTAPRYSAELMATGRDLTDLPLLAYPNSGETYDATTKTWTGESPTNSWHEGVREALAAGARLVGGCCRVGPTDISNLRRTLDGATSAR